ncbi:MAG TPA: hypothetical protein HA254_06780 [Candidatus Diapherotrites archaeon]|uniref:Uncharacterized protein n=1 Tax=Candidatus Iainarchaeum sp. TaxID=3101447 RepID=A0A7J4J1I0_9ARCH|nr:hypothetical protein [Candidatus Diapherotrites archaeon]
MTGKTALLVMGGLAAIVMAACSGPTHSNLPTSTPTQSTPTQTPTQIPATLSGFRYVFGNPFCSGEKRLDDSMYEPYCILPQNIVNATSTLPIVEGTMYPQILPDQIDPGWEIRLETIGTFVKDLVNPWYNTKEDGHSRRGIGVIYSNRFSNNFHPELQSLTPNRLIRYAGNPAWLTGPVHDFFRDPQWLLVNVYNNSDMPPSLLTLETTGKNFSIKLPRLPRGRSGFMVGNDGSVYLLDNFSSDQIGDTNPNLLAQATPHAQVRNLSLDLPGLVQTSYANQKAVTTSQTQ